MQTNYTVQYKTIDKICPQKQYSNLTQQVPKSSTLVNTLDMVSLGSESRKNKMLTATPTVDVDNSSATSSSSSRDSDHDDDSFTCSEYEYDSAGGGGGIGGQPGV